MLAAKCVTLAEVGALWHNGSVYISLLHLFFSPTSLLALLLSVSSATKNTVTHTYMKPGHAPSEQRNRQLPPVGLKGPDLKRILEKSQ